MMKINSLRISILDLLLDDYFSFQELVEKFNAEGDIKASILQSEMEKLFSSGMIQVVKVSGDEKIRNIDHRFQSFLLSKFEYICERFSNRKQKYFVEISKAGIGYLRDKDIYI